MKQTKQISAIDLMDLSLNVLKAEGPFSDQHSVQFKNIEVDNKLVARAWRQLVNDGFVYSQDKEHSPTSKTTRFYITLNGIIEIESCPFFLKGKPYKWKVVQNRLSIIWKVITVFGILLNAIVVLYFTYLTYLNS